MDMKLLKEAKALRLKLDDLERPAKLSKEAFQREAKEIAFTDESRLDRLAGVLTRPEYVYSNQFVRTACRWILESTCISPPKEVRRLSWLCKLDAVTAETAAVGSSIFELFALAVRIMAREHPEVFGTVENMEAHKKELEDTKEKYANALKKIESSYAPEDLIVDNPDNEGRARVSFKMTKGAVHLGDGFGERLVTWLKANPEAI